MAVGVDVDVINPDLAVIDAREAVAQIDVPFADRLDFRSDQLDPGLVGLEDVVVVKSLAVFRNALLRLLSFRSHGRQRAATFDASRAASVIASIMLDGSATFFPAMSNAVP